MNYSKLMFAKSKIIELVNCTITIVLSLVMNYVKQKFALLIKITFPQKDHNVFDH